MLQLEKEEEIRGDDIAMKCPVCGTEHNNGYSWCSGCGFNKFKDEFINEEEQRLWERETIDPCREIYWFMKEENEELSEDNSILTEQLKEWQEKYEALKIEYEKNPFTDKTSQSLPRVELGANDTIYEDENFLIKFLKWDYVRYLNTGNCYVGTFLFENKSNTKKCVYFKSTSVGGFMNQEETLKYDIPPKQKGMEKFNFVYEDRVPGNVKDFGSVEFMVCYGNVPDGYTRYIRGEIIESDTISLVI